jgi:sulfite reductase (ferredoxin)
MARPTRPTGAGQWAMGHREPLNASEQMKKDNDGLDVRARIENIYSVRGFSSIDGADLRGRMRWWGLYTQRAPGIDGGRTALLEPEELEDSYFMMRVRIPGGRLTSEQLRVVAGVATDFGRDVADITDRQNVQYHWIRIEDVPEIWRRLESVGLSSTEACGDTPRNMLGCPLAGIDVNEILDATPVLAEVNAFAIGNKEFSNLPRKWKTAISGCVSHCTVHEVNDVSFVGVRRDDGTVGFDLWVGGGLSTNPMFARRLGVFVTPEQVKDVWAGVTSVFRDYGYRRLRTRARVKFLMADWGPEKFREVLEKEYLGYALPDGPAAEAVGSGSRDHVGVHRQQDGKFYVGVAPRVGRVSGTLLAQVAELSDRYGEGEIRATVEQKLVLLGVAEADVEPLVDELERLDLVARPSAFRRGMMACTGIEFCKLAIVETKQRAMDLFEDLEKRMPDFDQPVSINVNGCPNSCARFQVADIGLKGSIVNGEEGFQVHLGGTMGAVDADPNFGRKVRGLKVTSAELTDYVERVLRHFEADRGADESFAAWVQRAPEEALT